MSLFKTVPMMLIHKTSGGYVKGIWQNGSETEISFSGTFQPASGKELENLPEGKRSHSIYKIFAGLENEFTSSDDLKQLEADCISLNGEVYQIIKVDKWDNGLLPHWEFLVERFAAEESDG